MRTHTVHSASDNTQMSEQIKMADMYNSIFLCTPILLKLYLLPVNILTCFVHLTAFECQITLWQHGILELKRQNLLFIPFFFFLFFYLFFLLDHTEGDKRRVGLNVSRGRWGIQRRYCICCCFHRELCPHQAARKFHLPRRGEGQHCWTHSRSSGQHLEQWHWPSPEMEARCERRWLRWWVKIVWAENDKARNRKPGSISEGRQMCSVQNRGRSGGGQKHPLTKNNS